jgi:hypothetical protein
MNKTILSTQNSADFSVQTAIVANKALAERAAIVPVYTEKDMLFAESLLTNISSRLEEIERDRRVAVHHLNDSIKSINNNFKTLSTPLEEAGKELKRKIQMYQALEGSWNGWLEKWEMQGEKLARRKAIKDLTTPRKGQGND